MPLTSFWLAAAAAASAHAEQTARIDLGGEFAAMSGYSYTQTRITAPPGAGRGLHSHVDFPEILTILSGELTETLDDGARLVHPAGSTVISEKGMRHSWANEGPDPLVFLATAIRKTPATR